MLKGTCQQIDVDDFDTLRKPTEDIDVCEKQDAHQQNIFPSDLCKQ